MSNTTKVADLQEDRIPTRKEQIDYLKSAIQIQTLQTELQELRTRMFGAKLDEIKIMAAFDNITKRSEEEVTPENVSEMQKEATEAINSQITGNTITFPVTTTQTN